MIDFPIENPTIEVIIGFFGVLMMGMGNVALNPTKRMTGEDNRPIPIQYQVEYGWRNSEEG